MTKRPGGRGGGRRGAAPEGRRHARPVTPPPSAASASETGVVLPPHAVAAFQVVWTTGPACTSVGRILVTAPGTQRAFTVTQPMRVCAGRVQVSPLSLDQEDD